jgi:hypothetical protein
MARAVATDGVAEGHKARREALARLLAAEIMGLVKDPLGSRLPTECWSQMMRVADAAMVLGTHTEAAKRDMESHQTPI